MAEAPAAITSPKIKKLAQKALKSPSMLTTAETRELGASVVAHLPPVDANAQVPAAKKASIKKAVAKKTAATKTSAKRA